MPTFKLLMYLKPENSKIPVISQWILDCDREFQKYISAQIKVRALAYQYGFYPLQVLLS